MNENINLCEILKEHEGETFYSPCYGYIILKAIKPYCYFSLFFNDNNSEYKFTKYGKISTSNDAECVLFPSKDQRDWNKWIEEQKPNVPKTWEELKRSNTIYTHYSLNYIVDDKDYFTAIGTNLIEKSALALLKIHQLIEVGYGGNVTNEEWKNTTKLKWYFVPNIADLFDVMCSQNYNKKRNIAFHTEEQAKEFLKYPENFQLLKDYFMI